MKIVGKLLLATALSVGVVQGSNLTNVFALKNQDFAELSSKKLNRYKMNDNFLFALKAAKVDRLDGYEVLHMNGMFKKAMLKNWVFTERAWLYDTNKKLIFTDDAGLDLVIETQDSGDAICTGGQCINNVLKQQVRLKVVFVNKTLTVSVNDQKLYTSKKRFGKLKNLTQEFYQGSAGNSLNDILIDCKLMEVK